MADKVKENKEIDRIKVANINRLNRTSDMIASKNNWFYLAIILINVITLVGAWLVESNANGVATDVFESIDYRYVYLLLVSLVCIALLKILPDYIFLYRKTKQRLFVPIIKGNIICEHYKTLTSKSGNINSLYFENLKLSNVPDATAKEIVNSRYVSTKIANTIYAFVLMVLGSIFVLRNTNLVLYVLAIIGLLLSVAWILIMLYFDKYKAKYLIIIGNLCKFLYRIKLIKDYEKLYNVLVVKLMQYGSVFKNNSIYIISQIFCGMFVKFVAHVILFFILSMFNVSTMDLFIEVLFKCVILDMVICLIPLPRGVFVYEILFLILFRSVFMSGYVLYAMIIYRVITYFLIQILFGVGYVFGIKNKLKLIGCRINEELNSNS